MILHRVAVLFSAGLDSAVLLAQAAQHGATVQPIYVSAGLAWEGEERAMAARLLSAPPYTAAEILPLVTLTVDMRDVYPASHWAIRGEPPRTTRPTKTCISTGETSCCCRRPRSTWPAAASNAS